MVAYVANQFGRLRTQGLAYASANIAGSGMLAVIAALEAQWGFLLLEGAWAAVSLAAALRQRAKPEKHRERRSSAARIAALVRWSMRRTRERRANLAYEDELRFELSKGLV